MTQRKYKVRFQSDIRRTKARRSGPCRGDLPAIRRQGRSAEADPSRPGPETSSAYGCIHCDRFDQECNCIPGSESQIRNAQGNEDLSAIVSELLAVQDATLLYTFSVGDHQDHEPRQETSGVSDTLYVSENGVLYNNDERSERNFHGEESNEIGEHSPSQSSRRTDGGASTPQLSFQADILPNIPQGISPSSTWDESPGSDRRFYLQYYIEKVVPRLMPLWTTSDNPFLCIIVPASMDSHILMHAVTALSTYHHSLQSSSSQDSLVTARQTQSNASVRALWHKQQVLVLLQDNLNKPDLLRDDTSLAACLLMQTFEVLCSGTSGWDHWLRGATLFIQMRGKLESDLKDSNSWMRLAKCVVAIETFAATSARFDLSVSDEYWNVYRRLRRNELREIAMGHRSQIEDHNEDKHFEKLVGCPVVVVYSLGRMVMLIKSRKENESRSAEDLDQQNAWATEAIKLEDLLLRWKPNTSDPDKERLAEAFRHASLIFYFRKVRRLPYSLTTIQYHVQSTFNHLLSITPSSQLEGIALWPTMIAAIEIDEETNQPLMDVAINCIKMMRRQEGDPLYNNAENALKLLWSRRRKAKTWEQRVAINWDDLSKEMGWQWCMV